MRVLARVNREGITIRQAMAHPSQSQPRQVGTLVLTNVRVGSNIAGEIVEENDRIVKPVKAVSSWPKMRYVQGAYRDMSTGNPVERAKAVYASGSFIHYLP